MPTPGTPPPPTTPLSDAQDALLVKYTNEGGGSYPNGAYKSDFNALTSSQKLKLQLLCAFLATLE